MKAIQITKFGGPEVMQLTELPDPIAGAGEEILDVTAIGINYADTHQTEDSYLAKQTLPLIPGIELVLLQAVSAFFRLSAKVDMPQKFR